MSAIRASSSGAADVPSASRAFSEASRSPGQARAFVRDVLQAWQLPTVEDDLMLLVSELATNVVLHARTSYDVVLERHGEIVRLVVLDDAPAGPVRRRSGLGSATGRGLALVETMSTDWGRVDDGRLGGRAKGIWCDVLIGVTDSPDEGAIYGTDWLAMLDEAL